VLVARVEPEHPHELQRLGLQLAQPELLGDRESFSEEAESLGAGLATDDEVGAGTGVDQRLRCGGRGITDELERSRVMRPRRFRLTCERQEPTARRLRLRSALAVAGLEQRAGRLLEDLRGGLVGDRERLSVLEQQAWPTLVVGETQIERLLPELRGSRVGVHGTCACGGRLHRVARFEPKLERGLPGGLRALEGRGVVVGDRVGAVEPVARERRHPLSSPLVPLGSLRTHDRPVRDVSDEGVLEDVLRLGGNRRVVSSTDQLPLLESAKRLVDRPRASAGDGGDCPRPEQLAHDRGVLDDRLVLLGDGVQPCSDDAVDRVGHGESLGLLEDPLAVPLHEDAPVHEHPDELLRVERVPLGSREQR
jgi:hypothetical protein